MSERASCWCHRPLVSMWLSAVAGLEVPELRTDGFAGSHPLLPPFLRTTVHPRWTDNPIASVTKGVLDGGA